MLKIHYISDIHIDSYINNHIFWNKSNENMKEQIHSVIKWILHKNYKKADILIINWDISNHNHQTIVFLEEIWKFYKKVLFVFWNHDLYLVSIEDKITYNTNSFQKIKELKKHFKNSNIHILDWDIINIEKRNKTYKLAWLPMWYDFSYGKQNLKDLDDEKILKLWKRRMNDSNYIFGENKKIINPLEYFKKEKNILNKLLKEKPQIIISHIWPIIPKNLPQRYKNDITNSFFYFDWKDILNKNTFIKYWFFWHTHNNYSFTYNQTKLLCNPLWYKHENIWNKIKEINIK